MTTGEGIFWATVLALFVLGIWYASKRKKWKLIGIIAAIVFAVSVAIGLAIYFYNLYQDRLIPQQSFFGISLGMLPVDVKLTLGEPITELNNNNSEGEDTLIYLFKDYEWAEVDKYVRFKKNGDEWRVYMICDLDPGGELYSLNTWTKEEDVLKKFGKSSHESISEDGLKKLLTFGQLNIAVGFEKRQVTDVCVTDSEEVSYIKAYETKLKPLSN